MGDKGSNVYLKVLDKDGVWRFKLLVTNNEKGDPVGITKPIIRPTVASQFINHQQSHTFGLSTRILSKLDGLDSPIIIKT